MEMNYAKFFECADDEPSAEALPGGHYEDALSAELLCEAALQEKARCGSVFVKLPSDLPAEVDFFQSKAAFAGNPPINADAIPALEPEDEPFGSILRAVELLAGRGERVVLKLEGPFTILGAMLPLKELYKGLYKNPQGIRSLCGRLVKELVRYVQAAAERGAVLFSYADPVISYKLVSARLSAGICGEITCEALQALLAADSRVRLHICSAASVGLKERACCRTIRHRVPEGLTYGEALDYAVRQTDLRLLGHGCMQQEGRRLAEPYIYEIKILQ